MKLLTFNLTSAVETWNSWNGTSLKMVETLMWSLFCLQGKARVCLTTAKPRITSHLIGWNFIKNGRNIYVELVLASRESQSLFDNSKTSHHFTSDRMELHQKW